MKSKQTSPPPAVAQLRLVRPMRTAVVFLALTTSMLAGALPDDATLTRRILGTWHSYRHDRQYRADGAWILDPSDNDQNMRGKWRIEHDKLIETWRSAGESSDSTTVDEIIELTRDTLKFRTTIAGRTGTPGRSRSPERRLHIKPH
jgi:hypothetical protein